MILPHGENVPHPLHELRVELLVANGYGFFKSVLQRVCDAPRIGNGALQAFPVPCAEGTLHRTALRFERSKLTLYRVQETLATIQLLQNRRSPEPAGPNAHSP